MLNQKHLANIYFNSQISELPFFLIHSGRLLKDITNTSTMKNIICLVLMVFSYTLSFAQEPDFDDLKILYADGKYEKLVASAHKYSMKEHLVKHPLPYLWMAKGLYKISLSGIVSEDYKDPYKEAIGCLSKAMKADKDSTCINTHKEFVDEFQMSMVERVSNALSSEKFKDAAGWAVKYYKITKHPIGPKYIEAAAKYRAGDKSGATIIWKECEKILPEILHLEGWSDADKDLFVIGLLQTSECYINAKQEDKSVALFHKVAPWFEEHEAFKAHFDQIIK